MNFKITSELLADVKGTWGRYEANRLERMALKEVEVTNKVTQTEKDIEFINVEVEKGKSSLRVADDIIDDAKTKLEEAL